MSEQKNKNIALVATIIFAVIVLLILLFGVIRSVIPPKHENVVELNFLEREGLFEPTRLALGERGIQTDAPAPETPAQPAISPLPPASPTVSQNDNVIAQSHEETVAIAREQERKRQEKAQRQREQEAINRANALAAGAFTSPAGTGSGSGEAAVQSGSSQGSPDGGSATGTLSGSSALRGRFGGSPAPRYNVNESGTVAVNIIVDAAGRVTRAEVALGGTTTNSLELRRAAIDAALKASFSPQQGARTETGTITYVFKLN
ncbi:MAG: TonB family protein [Prevotellaceae bacterium]|jgi:TonB family protein|nr:TonB family protein [Prevotellaceae bacterium]